MRPPLFAELQELLWFRKLSPAKCLGESFAHAVVVHRPDIGPTEIEQEQHLSRPSSDSTNCYQSCDDFFIAHFFQGAPTRHCPVERFCRQIFDRGDLTPGKTGSAQFFIRCLKNLSRIKIFSS